MMLENEELEQAKMPNFASRLIVFRTKEVKCRKIESAILVGQKSVNYYIQMVVVALLSVVLVGFVILVSVILVVDCICFFNKKRKCRKI